MYSLKIYKKWKDILDLLKNDNNKDLIYIVKSLDEIVEKWLKSSNIKNIWNDIYRKRVWRWRILFTISENIFHVWIIEVEKNTRKDYKKWKDYIISQVK